VLENLLVHTAAVENEQALELRVRQVDRTAAVAAEVPRQHGAGFGVSVPVHFDFVLACLERDLRLHEAQVVGERGARDFLAVGAVAEHGAAVIARHRVLNRAAETGTADGCWGGFGHPRRLVSRSVCYCLSMLYLLVD